jgi:hypothetical protein
MLAIGLVISVFERVARSKAARTVAPEVLPLSHTKLFQCRFAEVDAPTNLSTHPVSLLIQGKVDDFLWKLILARL